MTMISAPQKNEPYSPYDEEEVDKWMREMPESFKVWLQMQYETQLAYLLNAVDLLTIGRYQGRIEVLEQLRRIKGGR